MFDLYKRYSIPIRKATRMLRNVTSHKSWFQLVYPARCRKPDQSAGFDVDAVHAAAQTEQIGIEYLFTAIYIND